MRHAAFELSTYEPYGQVTICVLGSRRLFALQSEEPRDAQPFTHILQTIG